MAYTCYLCGLRTHRCVSHGHTRNSSPSTSNPRSLWVATKGPVSRPVGIHGNRLYP